MTLEDLQSLADRLSTAQFNHQLGGGKDNLYGLAFEAIRELGDKVHGKNAVKMTMSPAMRRYMLRVVE